MRAGLFVTIVGSSLALASPAAAWTQVQTGGTPPSVRGGGQMRQVGDELIRREVLPGLPHDEGQCLPRCEIV